MDVIRRTDLERLALQGAGPCVSLFLPTHRAGPEVQQAPIRLKNLLREATEALKADGVKAPMVHSVLAPLRRLVNDGLFWQYQSDGLALYSRPGWWRALRVPLDLPELAVVADRFHNLAGTGLTSRDPREIIRAAKQGRVETLFAARQPTGVNSPNDSPSPNGDRALRDVLEVAAVTTLVKGGAVYALPAGAAPGGGGAAAVFRY